MKDIKKLHYLYLLKDIERFGGDVAGRAESVADHTYSTLILAQYFLSKIKQKLNELKVMKMLLYHDIIELEAGDIFVLDEKRKKKQKEMESKAFKILKKKIPDDIAKEAFILWEEYEKNKTKEAKFCQAIDRLDPIIHYLLRGDLWKKHKFTEENLRKKKEKYFDDFPVILAVFNKILKFAKKKDYYFKE